MRFSLDNIFGIHEQALKLSAKRAEIIANNLANADTPNYKAKDVDFDSLLQNYKSKGAGTVEKSHAGHVGAPGSSGVMSGLEVMYRVPLQPSADGNTVESAVEQMNYAENAMRYQASIRFLDGRIKGLLSALKGE